IGRMLRRKTRDRWDYIARAIQRDAEGNKAGIRYVWALQDVSNELVRLCDLADSLASADPETANLADIAVLYGGLAVDAVFEGELEDVHVFGILHILQEA